MARAKGTSQRGGFWRVVRWMFVLAILAGGVAAWFVHEDYRRFVDVELDIGEEERVLEVRRGDSFVDVLERLRRAGIREGHDLYWKALAWEQGAIARLQVGEYSIGHGMSPTRLLAKLEQGRVIQHRFTIVEGWTFRELRLALAKEAALEQTLVGLSDEAVMQQLGAGGEHPEGRFLPETYHYTKGFRDIDLLKRTHLAMRSALREIWERRVPDLPFDTPYEALVLASIIEKETGLARERPEIAGVFVRRMRLGMRLQTDPTVIYGLGSSFDGNLTRAHLRSPTPYNTYTQFGLPPTPIALPGRAAIEAAVNPAPGETLYFVSRGDGSHAFSKTLTEHNRAVARYQLGRR